MNCQKILLATDFSPPSQAALEYASALAQQWNARLVIAHIEEPPSPVSNELLLMTEPFPNPEIRRMLEAVVPPDRPVRYEHRVVPGVAAEEIARLAEQEHADLIVVGTHGRSGVARLLMGSVAEAVVRHAKCPVLTVKSPAHSSVGATHEPAVASSHAS